MIVVVVVSMLVVVLGDEGSVVVVVVIGASADGAAPGPTRCSSWWSAGGHDPARARHDPGRRGRRRHPGGHGGRRRRRGPRRCTRRGGRHRRPRRAPSVGCRRRPTRSDLWSWRWPRSGPWSTSSTSHPGRPRRWSSVAPARTPGRSGSIRPPDSAPRRTPLHRAQGAVGQHDDPFPGPQQDPRPRARHHFDQTHHDCEHRGASGKQSTVKTVPGRSPPRSTSTWNAPPLVVSSATSFHVRPRSTRTARGSAVPPRPAARPRTWCSGRGG